MFRAIPWQKLVTIAGAGALVNSVFEHETLGQHVIFPTFRVVIVVGSVGTIAVKLRFGFTDADADVATQGIDFAALGALNASDTRAPVWVNGAVAPNFVGQPYGILPPRMAIIASTSAGWTGQAQLHYSGLETS